MSARCSCKDCLPLCNFATLLVLLYTVINRQCLCPLEKMAKLDLEGAIPLMFALASRKCCYGSKMLGTVITMFKRNLIFALGCRQHPWFNQHLPRYLAVIQADTMATSPLIDTDMVDEVTKLGFDREEVIQSVKHRQQNKVWLVAVLVISQQQDCNAGPIS